MLPSEGAEHGVSGELLAEPEWPEAAVEPFQGAGLRTSDQ
jgi:hypothetical protein